MSLKHIILEIKRNPTEGSERICTALKPHIAVLMAMLTLASLAYSASILPQLEGRLIAAYLGFNLMFLLALYVRFGWSPSFQLSGVAFALGLALKCSFLAMFPGSGPSPAWWELPFESFLVFMLWLFLPPLRLGYSLEGCRVPSLDLRGLDVSISSFSTIDLERLAMHDCRIEGDPERTVTLRIKGLLAHFCFLSGITCDLAEVEGARLHCCELKDVTIKGGTLAYCRWSASKLTAVQILDTPLTKSVFLGCHFKGCRLENVDLPTVTFGPHSTSQQHRVDNSIMR